ncbi:MAG: hypothetical protein ACYC8T_23815, partial [Myxococcaceae bacterium]
SEAGFLAETLQVNSNVFTPEAAEMFNQFLGQYGRSFDPGALPDNVQAPQRGGWAPTSSATRSDLNVLRQHLGQLLEGGKPISFSDAQVLMNRALKNDEVAPEGVRILAEAFQANRGSFSPEAGMAMNNFLMVNQGRANPNPSAWGQPSTPSYGGRGDGFEAGGVSRPQPRAEHRALASLRDTFVKLMSNDGVVTPAEVQTLLTQASNGGQPTQAAIGLLVQGFNDNQGRFTVDAAQMMRQFFGQYGMY